MTSIEELRAKSLLLTGYLEWMLRHYFSRQTKETDVFIDIFTPSDPTQRGCQLSLFFSIPVSDIFNKLTECGVVVSKACLE